MARLVVSMNLSVDGYIAAAGHDDGAWLRIDEEVHRAFNERAAAADAFLYGRKVYEAMIPYWPDAAASTTNPDYEREYARIWVDKPKVVFSTSLTETRWSTRVVPIGAVREEVLRLQRQARGELLCYGGAQIAAALQEQGLVDEYELFVHPNALGGGLPFFRRGVRLGLIDVRRFETGTLRLRYSTAGSG